MSKKNNNRLMFGTGGVPLSAVNRDTMDGIRRIADLGLDMMEMEFVHGVRMGKEKAEEVGKLAKGLGVKLTIHAPYYINLNAVDPKKRAESRQRIIDSCEIGSIAGANSVCFHAAFKLGQESEQVFEKVISEMILIEEELQKLNINNIFLAPELTGKETQFGDLIELVALASNLDQTRLCIDFAHLFARYAGTKNSYEEFVLVIKKIKDELGIKFLERLHMHFSGINYTAKGERNHTPLEESNFNWKALIKALYDENVGGYLVCESPLLEEDALMAKKYYESLDEK